MLGGRDQNDSITKQSKSDHNFLSTAGGDRQRKKVCDHFELRVFETVSTRGCRKRLRSTSSVLRTVSRPAAALAPLAAATKKHWWCEWVGWRMGWARGGPPPPLESCMLSTFGPAATGWVGWSGVAPFTFRIINLKRCYSYSANSPRHPSISARGGEPPLHRHSTFVTRSMGPLGGPMGQPWCPPCQGSGVPRSSGGQNAQRQFARCTQPWSPLPVPTPSHLGGPRSPALSPGASRCGSISNLRNQLVPV